MSPAPGYHLLLLALTLSVDLGCGHCDGAIRLARAQRAEWSGGRDFQPRLDAPQPVAIGTDETFRLVADGPLRSGAELLVLSGIGPASWVLLDHATGKAVPAEITADAGGHLCRNGVGFKLRPLQPLRPGDYTMVVYLEALRWPLVGPSSERASHGGKAAIVRRYRVAR